MQVLLNRNSMSVHSDKGWKTLTPTEYSILYVLSSHPGQIYSSSQLYQQIWQQTPFACDGLISVHIHNIREKIEADPSKPRHLLMKRGRGYLYSNAN